MSDSPRDKLPPGAIVNAEIVVYQYLDAEKEGQLSYCVWYDGDVALSGLLGLLELAKRDLIERCD